MVLGYVKTVMDSPALSISFSNNRRRLRICYRSRDCEKRQLLAHVRQNREFIVDSGYTAEENSEEAFSESTINAFGFGPPPTTNRWWISHMVA